jgi:hypothetical protein
MRRYTSSVTSGIIFKKNINTNIDEKIGGRRKQLNQREWSKYLLRRTYYVPSAIYLTGTLSSE